jgi:hypothetical protein
VISSPGTWAFFAVPVLLSCFTTGCGYHVAGTTNLLPTDIHTIAVTPWNNIGVQYKLSNLIAEALTREMISRTRYRIVSDPAQADAVLSGAVASMSSTASIADPVSGRTTGGAVSVRLQVKLVDKSGKVLFNQPNLDFRERYELSFNPSQYFDESGPALRRLSQDAAKTVVSAILEKF